MDGRFEDERRSVRPEHRRVRVSSTARSWSLRCGLAVIVVLACVSDQAAAARPDPARIALTGPMMSGPSHATLGARITFVASDVPPGTYTMRLVIEVIPDRIVAGTACAATVGVATADAHGRVAVTGRLPRRLACRSGAGPVEGYYPTRPGGHYRVSISRDVKGLPFGGEPFLLRPFRITG